MLYSIAIHPFSVWEGRKKGVLEITELFKISPIQHTKHLHQSAIHAFGPGLRL